MVREKKTLLSLVFIVTVIFIAQSQEISPINLSDDWEVWYDKVPVSGDIRVGLMAVPDNSSIDPSYFYVNLPEHKEQQLCCEVSSRDGRYEANLIYNIKDLEPGYHRFKIPTKHKKALNKYAASDISILTSIGDDCKDSKNYYAVASWNQLDALTTTDTVFLLLNSDRRTFIIVENKELSKDEEYLCKKNRSTSSVAYNCVCKIPARQLKEETQLYILQKSRGLGRGSIRSYPLTIKLNPIEKN